MATTLRSCREYHSPPGYLLALLLVGSINPGGDARNRTILGPIRTFKSARIDHCVAEDYVRIADYARRGTSICQTSGVLESSCSLGLLVGHSEVSLLPERNARPSADLLWSGVHCDRQPGGWSKIMDSCPEQFSKREEDSCGDRKMRFFNWLFRVRWVYRQPAEVEDCKGCGGCGQVDLQSGKPDRIALGNTIVHSACGGTGLIWTNK